jgi:hypothetical protein
MADSGKFQADPARVQAAQDSMEGISDLVRGIFKQFDESFGDLSFLYDDEVGNDLRFQVKQQREQFGQAGEAMGEAFDAVPGVLQKQGTYLEKSQLGVLDSIHQSDVHEPPHVRGGRAGK